MHIIKGSPLERWAQVEAVQHEPFVYISSNGSHWFDEEPDDVQLLLNALHRRTLDPVFESYGNFITTNPCRGIKNPQWSWGSLLPQYIDGPRLFDANVTMFHGNFYGVSHCFNIYTNDKDIIEKLTAAIRANQATKEYAEAKDTCGEKIVWGKKTLTYGKHRGDLSEVNHA